MGIFDDTARFSLRRRATGFHKELFCTELLDSLTRQPKPSSQPVNMTGTVVSGVIKGRPNYLLYEHDLSDLVSEDNIRQI